MVCTHVYSICTCVGFGTCIPWLYLKLIGSCIVWGSVRLMYHVRLIHWDFSLESQCPSACINCCFLVPSLWATEASFFRQKESIFVKWGVRLIMKCMNCIYCTDSLHWCTRTCPVSQFYAFHMPSLCGMNKIILSACISKDMKWNYAHSTKIFSVYLNWLLKVPAFVLIVQVLMCTWNFLSQLYVFRVNPNALLISLCKPFFLIGKKFSAS